MQTRDHKYVCFANKYGDVPHGYFRKLTADGDVELFCCFVNGHQVIQCKYMLIKNAVRFV